MSRFSRYTEKLLRKSGWYPGRKADIDFVEVLRDWLWVPNAPAMEFLNEFGGLVLHVPSSVISRKLNLYFGDMPYIFEISSYNEGGYDDRKSILGNICPIGYSDRSLLEIFISDNGLVYESDVYIERLGGHIIKCGNNTTEAIEYFCRARRGEVVATIPRKECSPQCQEGRHK